jgi:hypothetical protein
MVCVHNGTTAKMNESFIHEWDSPAKRAPARRETGKFKKKKSNDDDQRTPKSFSRRESFTGLNIA